MSNVFKKLGIGIADFGKWLAGAVEDTVNLAAKVEKILKAARPLEAPFVAGLATVVTDVEALVAASTAAISSDGINLPADSKVYQEFLTMIADFKKLAPIAAEAIAILEGKAPATPASAAATPVTAAK